MASILEYLGRPEVLASSRSTASRQRECIDIYLAALGLTRDVQRVIHVTGTKGKGTTCSMAESILRARGYKTGLFTSPHIHDHRERIKINGRLLESDYFFERVQWCWDRLKTVESETVPFPEFFTFLTLLALRIFEDLQVDVRILEVGIGGRLDPTNLVTSPVVCGFAPIGLDHMQLLGDTVYKIAMDKGGIIKRRVPAYTVDQSQDAFKALKECAAHVKTNLLRVPPLQKQTGALKGYLAQNASLAIVLAKEFEDRYPQSSPSSESSSWMDAYIETLSNFSMKGRAQIIHGLRLEDEPVQQNVTIYVDGAHTVESVEACAEWIGMEWKGTSDSNIDVLLFNCHQSKSPREILFNLHRHLKLHNIGLHLAFFPPLLETRQSLLPVANSVQPAEWQRTQLQAWKSLADPSPKLPIQLPSLGDHVLRIPSSRPDVRSEAFATLRGAFSWLSRAAKTANNANLKLRVLATGSLYFASDVLKLVDRSSF